MRFQAEGEFPVTIKAAMLAMPKFAKGPNDFDVCLQVEDAEGHSDWWRGEVSDTYGKGSFSNMTQKEITLATLERIGLPDGDLARVDELIGVETVAYVKASESKGVTYYNIRGLGSGGADVKPLDPDDAKRRMAAMFGVPAPAAATVHAPAATASATTTARRNPFGG